MFETNILGNILARYDHGPDRILAETEGGSTRTWLTDALRTPVKRLDEVGVYSVTRYDEYGKVEEENSPDTPRFGFTGHQRGPEQEPDLYYAQQRWYSAATGRFISEDPIWGTTETPPSLHRYLYAYANPTVYIDPDGRAVVMRGGEIEQVFDAANRGDGLAVNTQALRTLVREHDLGEFVGMRARAHGRGDMSERFLSSAGVARVADILAHSWDGQDAPHAFLIVESDDTAESVSAEFLRQVGDFGGLMAPTIAAQLGERAAPGAVFDISFSVSNAEHEARQRVATQRLANSFRARRQEMSTAGRAATGVAQFGAEVMAATETAIRFSTFGDRAPASIRSEAQIEAAMAVTPLGLIGRVRHAKRGSVDDAAGNLLQPRFRSGPQGRLESAFARIEPHHLGTGTETNATARLFARTFGNAGDDAGHAIGRNLGGSGTEVSNIIPQASSVNRGAFRQFEQQVARQVEAGNEVFVRVVPKYASGAATRPTHIVYQVRVNGQTITRTFNNP